MHSSIRILNLYSHGTRLYELEYSVYVLFLTELVIPKVTKVHTLIPQLSSLMLFNMCVMWIDCFVTERIPFPDPLFSEMFFKLAYIKVWFLSRIVLSVLINEECHVSITTILFRIGSSPKRKSPSQPFPHAPKSLENSELFFFPEHSYIFSFPGCLTIGITLYIAFSDWLISHQNMCLRFLHVLSCLASSFLITEYYSIMWRYHSLPVFLLK